ncbi:GntR family transcriptional regulator [Frigidibacter sp. ROC022]|uniref:GntR family transcriptional regulator n=1 Tax=Frigidibacter sp. ROC022 TaxID=2971796 RepID=UPI00215AFF4F|nr:GntR family transcriptional regulator [Frigidibacter sp. ROC022]MCR8726009.1 GntR family transcriptional regulator [Frigidibacter sp. ROC022]
MTDTAKPATLRNLAHERFMEKLNAGALRPAQLVSQRELCGLLDMPMGPMREALKRLEGEGVVTLIPQRGIKILDIDEKTINDAFQMRLLIEIEAVRVFAERGDKAAAAELRDRTRAAGEQSRPRETLDLAEINALTALDHEMHRLFVSALDNAFANDLFDRMLGRLQLSRLVFRLRNYTDERAIREHLTILGSVIDGDGDRAAEAMAAHLKASWRRALGMSD